MIVRSQLLTLIACTSLVLVTNCATDEAARLREEKPISVGLIGAAFRPNNTLTVAIDLNQMASTNATPGRINFSDMFELIDRDVKATGFQFDAYGAHHLWEDSAFYVGGGLRFAQGRVSFNTKSLTSSLETEPVEYKRSDVYLTIPIGWYWIWNPGFTLALDLGPNIRISSIWKVSTSGSNVNVSDRDDYADKIDSQNNFGIGGRGIIGWSF